MTFYKKTKHTFNLLTKPTYGLLAAVVMIEEAAAQSGSSSGTAVDVAMVNNLGATVKAMLQGNGAVVVDSFILIAAAYAAIMSRSPAPMIFGILTCGAFHIGINLLIK